jgi:hypothetical protein
LNPFGPVNISCTSVCTESETGKDISIEVPCLSLCLLLCNPILNARLKGRRTSLQQMIVNRSDFLHMINANVAYCIFTLFGHNFVNI